MRLKEISRSKALYKFLKKKCILQEFIEAIVDSNSSTILGNYAEKKDLIRMFDRFHGNIGEAFVWAHTKQGHNFWDSLNTDFMVYFKTISSPNTVKKY